LNNYWRDAEIAETLGIRQPQVWALRTDKHAVRVVRGRGAIDLALGESLLELFKRDRLLRLGYSKRSDYMRERVGLPLRTTFLWLRLAESLRERPLLRRAVVTGVVKARKALTVLPVAKGEEEGFWTAAAMTATVAELEQGVRAAGREPGQDTFETETIWLKMTAAQQDVLDAAIAAARERLGLGAERWKCIEAICQEWLGTFGALVPDENGPEVALAPAPMDLDAWRAELGGRTEAITRQLRAIDEAFFVIQEETPDDVDPRALDARIQRLLEARRSFDEAFGPLAEQIVYRRVWEQLGYGSLEAYCRERLGLSPRTVRHRAWLEWKICALPELGEALYAGRLTYSKALLVAKNATPHDVEERIAAAAATTLQQTERESTEEEERRNRAAGVRRLWGPKDAVQTVTDAIVSAQAAWVGVHGESPDAGQALALVAEYFLKVSKEHRPGRSMPRERREVLMRYGGKCAAPGCTRDARHVHHVTFRSRGGSNAVWNKVPLCSPHHLHGIHRGYLTLNGKAGSWLVWRFGTAGEAVPGTAGEAVPLEEWETIGDDDVRRLDLDPKEQARAAARADI
jgi:hypothetical protein